MKIEVKYFGIIAEKIKLNEEVIELSFDSEINLKSFFEDKYPVLCAMNFKIAINQELNEVLNNSSRNVEVALLPPFAGG